MIPTWNLIGFFDDNVALRDQMISHYGKCLGNIDDLNDYKDELCVAIAIGNPNVAKMIVEKIDIPLSESVDDSAYDIRTNEQKNKRSINDKFIRLRLLKKVDNPKLHLDCLRAFGLKSSMQTNLKVSGDLLKYIEEQTK